MTKKHFIALADHIRRANRLAHFDEAGKMFDTLAVESLADFCQSQNPQFNRERWLGYIAGTNGKNGWQTIPTERRPRPVRVCETRGRF